MSQARYVVDASVGVMLYLKEPLSSRAVDFFRGLKGEVPFLLHVPDFFYVEVAHVLLKAIRGGKVDPHEAAIAIADLCSLAIVPVPSSELAEDALAVAQESGTSAYDACYVALSDRVDAPLVTADKRLVNALAGSPHRVQWLGDVQAEQPSEDGRIA